MKNFIFIIMVVVCHKLYGQSKVGVQLEINSPLMSGQVETNPLATIKAGIGTGFGIELITTINHRLEFQYGIFNAGERYKAYDLHPNLDLLMYDHNYIKIPVGIGIYDKKSYDDFYWKFTLSIALQIGTITMGDKYNKDLASILVLPDEEKSTYYTFLFTSELSFNHGFGNSGQLKYGLSMNISPFNIKQISDSGMNFRLTAKAWPAIGVTYYPFSLSGSSGNKLRNCR